MTLFFVSLISRDNHPLYIQPFSPYEKQVDKKAKMDNEQTEDLSFIEERNANELLKYNFLSHMSLDIFESPFTPTVTTTTTTAASNNNIGGGDSGNGGKNQQNKIYNLLFVQDGIFVFGYETNTGLKIVIGASRKENEMELNNDGSCSLNSLFKEIHKCYLGLMCNPFKSIENENQEINDNVVFDRKIKKVVEKWNQSH